MRQESSNIHSNQREHEILKVLAESGSARIHDLSQRLGVTEETIRRNVRRMESVGLVNKVHGGVYLRGWGPAPTFAQRIKEHALAKQRIARHVAGIIHDGESLFLDTGSTTSYVAQALRNHQGLLVVTNSLSVAQALTSGSSNRVFFAGGELRSHDGGAFGAEALAFVRQFRVHHAVLSVAAVRAETGFMLHDLREAEFSRQIIDCSESAMLAADASKFERYAPIRLTEPKNISRFICDIVPPAPIVAWMQTAGVKLEVADVDGDIPATDPDGGSQD